MRQDEIIAENSPSPTTNTQINASGTPVSPIDTPLAIYFYKYFEGLKINDIKEILNKDGHPKAQRTLVIILKV